MTESELEEAVAAECRRLGIARFHFSIRSPRAASCPPGWPDEVLVGRRGILWRELKNPSRKPTPAQNRVKWRLRAAGANVEVWRPADLYSGRIRRELEAIA